MKKLLIIGFVWPEPNSTAAGSRLMQLIEMFQNDGWDITFATTAVPSGNEFNLNSLGITTKKITLNSVSFDNFIKILKPEVVMFDRFMIEEQFGWRVEEHCPDAVKILDTEDLHFLRKAREKVFKAKKKLEKQDLLSDYFRRELAAMYRCDLNLIISSFEYELLQSEFDFPRYLLHYIPFVQAAIQANSIEKLPNFNHRKDFITIGNFLHAPNLDSVLFLKETIWPIIKKQLPAAVMNVYGAYGYEKAQRMHDPKGGFLIHGRAQNANRVLKEARVCLSPLRFGAGLKGKFIDAMNAGTPIVTTSIGAEGMTVGKKWAGCIEDEPHAIAKNAILLYENSSEWQKAQGVGFDIINSLFKKEMHQSSLIDALNEAIRNKKQLRQRNIVGQLLKYHQLQSTKYMAKWIEEKNK
ncbi:glycosyltransferase family 4 protein [Spongiivirga sp. MCCC 1A20706]|uniref:glycosyltransferase family 4 protein n=1 Tax=Spongiivirga sp. MCCC 1A20706 TaxID=3160963 RepID=UPI0039773767